MNQQILIISTTGRTKLISEWSKKDLLFKTVIKTPEEVINRSEHPKYYLVIYNNVKLQKEIMVESMYKMLLYRNPFLLKQIELRYLQSMNYICTKDKLHSKFFENIKLLKNRIYTLYTKNKYIEKKKFLTTHTPKDLTGQNSNIILKTFLKMQRGTYIIYKQKNIVDDSDFYATIRGISNKTSIDDMEITIDSMKLNITKGYMINNVYIIYEMEEDISEIIKHSKHEVVASSYNRNYDEFRAYDINIVEVKGVESNIEHIIPDIISGSKMKGYTYDIKDVKSAIINSKTDSSNREYIKNQNSKWDKMSDKLHRSVFKRYGKEKSKEYDHTKVKWKTGKTCEGKKKKEFTPRDYQRRAMVNFINSEKRGMGFFHTLGSGKSCTSILILDKLYENYDNVFILTPASLSDNFIKEYCEVCGLDIQRMPKFKFISIKGGGYDKIPPHMDNSIIVIDEVQILCNAARNKASGDTTGPTSELYNRVRDSVGSKILALSGTPIYASTYDLHFYTDLLSPGLFPRNREKFMDIISNDNLVMKKLKGLISYVKAESNKEGRFPELVFNDIIKVKMSSHQFEWYRQERVKEIRMDKYRKKDVYMPRYLMSRRLCNFSYPEEIQRRIAAINKTTAVKKALSDKNNNQWIDASFMKELQEYSPKFYQLFLRLSLPGKHLIFSEFTNNYGLYGIEKMLEVCDIKPLLYTGDVSKKNRKENLELFNHKDNINGENNKVLLISSAGYQGLNLFAVQHVHIVDAQLNVNDTKQLLGRARRMNSHVGLPDDQWKINVWIYHSTLRRVLKDINGNIELDEDETTEEKVYRQAHERHVETERITELLKRSAGDCIHSDITDCYKGNIIEDEELKDIINIRRKILNRDIKEKERAKDADIKEDEIGEWYTGLDVENERFFDSL